MKKRLVFFVLALTVIASVNVNAQNVIGRLADRAKNAAENAVGNKIENAINDAVDKAGKKVKDNKQQNDAAAVEDADPTVATSSDFKRGDKILFQDDFSSETVGEFPSKWELNNGKAEVKTFNGVKAVEITNNGYITPLIKQEGAYLTEEFTVEFTYYYWPDKEDIGTNDIKLFLNSDTDRSREYGYVVANEEIAFVIGLPVCGGSGASYEFYNGKKDIHGDASYEFSKGWHNVQVSFNKRALKVYIDGNRIINLPQVAQPTWVALQVPFDYSNLTFVKEFVLAQGAVELYDRNASDLETAPVAVSAVEKAIEETGKFVTNNILFETGKADLKTESMIEIMKVADYMKKNPTARFEVQGHCDNQGSDKVNDPLSQARSEAIVKALVGLGVDEFNLKATGKGSHEPVADNSTEEGRAQNRRVEFIKR